MEKKVYYSERNVDINELVKNLSGVERLSLAFSADAEAEIEDVRLVLDKENNIALMFSFNLCKEESGLAEKVWSLFYLPNLTLRYYKKRPEVTVAGGNADIWQETEFMYAHLRGQNLRVGLIKPVAPVLSTSKAGLRGMRTMRSRTRCQKFFCSRKESVFTGFPLLSEKPHMAEALLLSGILTGKACTAAGKCIFPVRRQRRFF